MQSERKISIYKRQGAGEIERKREIVNFKVFFFQQFLKLIYDNLIHFHQFCSCVDPENLSSKFPGQFFNFKAHFLKIKLLIFNFPM